LLEQHRLTATIMSTINEVLESKGLLLKGDMIVDATIIHAPPSTKNESKKRYPEKRLTKKGKDRFFCMKMHGVQTRTAADMFWGVALKASAQYKLTEANKRVNRKMSSIRSRVEHVFLVIKRQFGYTKVRYKGLAKNAAQVFTLTGLTGLYLATRAMLT